VWAWYAWRRAQVRACDPNAAHRVLARWSREHPGCRVITQNVDDLHVRAGTQGLLRLHGSLWELSCAGGCAPGSTAWTDEDASASALRHCPHCGAIARPAVVWFGETLDPRVVTEALEATACDVFLAVGTSAMVYPAAGLVHQARRRGAFTVEINTEATAASEAVDLVIPGAAEQVLPALDELLLARG
jgi:NAD-dependent deacetylase